MMCTSILNCFSRLFYLASTSICFGDMIPAFFGISSLCLTPQANIISKETMAKTLRDTISISLYLEIITISTKRVCIKNVCQSIVHCILYLLLTCVVYMSSSTGVNIILDPNSFTVKNMSERSINILMCHFDFV